MKDVIDIPVIERAIEKAIESFNNSFPLLKPAIDVKAIREQTLRVVSGYITKFNLLPSEKVVAELKGYKLASEELINESIDLQSQSAKGGYEEPILIGMIEVAWIGEMLRQILHPKLKQQKEIGYTLWFDDVEKIKRTSDYNYLTNTVSLSKGMTYKNASGQILAKVFVPELAYIMFRKDVEYTERGKETKGVFDGTQFLSDYVEGYKRGLNDFDRDFGVDVNTLYGVNAGSYVNNIHHMYFHADLGVNDEGGWLYWAKTHPFHITPQSISEYGYYAGLINKVVELGKKHPQLFKDLDKCEIRKHREEERKEDNRQNADTPNNDILLSTIGDSLFEFKAIMTAEGYKTLISALKIYFESGTFPKVVKRIKVGKVNKKRFGWVLNQIYRTERTGNLPKEYLLFAKQNISLFADVAFDENDVLGSNLYKYFTTKTK